MQDNMIGTTEIRMIPSDDIPNILLSDCDDDLTRPSGYT
jgi:hypothetical protein